MDLVNSLKTTKSNIQTLDNESQNQVLTNNATAVDSDSNLTSDDATVVDDINKLDTFGSLLDTILSRTSDVSSSLSTMSNIDDISIASQQSQFLSEIGLNNVNLSSLTISDDMITQMQQELLSSLQASMISIPTMAVSASENSPLSSTDNLPLKSLATTPATSQVDELESIDSSLLDDIYSFSFGDEGVDDNDLFDSINILNHIPIVSDIYQISTDTEISPVSKLAGGFLYSGPIGAGVAALELGMNYFTGYSTKDLVTDAELFVTLTDDQTETQ